MNRSLPRDWMMCPFSQRDTDFPSKVALFEPDALMRSILADLLRLEQMQLLSKRPGDLLIGLVAEENFTAVPTSKDTQIRYADLVNPAVVVDHRRVVDHVRFDCCLAAIGAAPGEWFV
jgi:hypothetical protein